MRVVAVSVLLALCMAVVSAANQTEGDLQTRGNYGRLMACSPSRAAGLEPLVSVQAGVGRGYDIVDELVRAPVFQYTYDRGCYFRDIYQDSNNFLIPDQVYARSISTKHIAAKSDYFESWRAVLSFKLKFMGLGIGLGFGGVSLGFSMMKARAELKALFANGANVLVMEDRLIAMHELQVDEDEDLHPRLQRAFDRLPAQMDSREQKDAYLDVIRSWGTHVITTAQFGGHLNQTVTFSRSLTQKFGMDWSMKQAGLSIAWNGFSLGLDKGKQSTTAHASKDFDANAENGFGVAGGDPFALSSNGDKGYSKWVPTIASNPALLLRKARLVGLHEFILEPKRSANMRRALRSYVENRGKVV